MIKCDCMNAVLHKVKSLQRMGDARWPRERRGKRMDMGIGLTPYPMLCRPFRAWLRMLYDRAHALSYVMSPLQGIDGGEEGLADFGMKDEIQGLDGMKVEAGKVVVAFG